MLTGWACLIPWFTLHAGESGASPAGTSSFAIWHVIVDGKSQGPSTGPLAACPTQEPDRLRSASTPPSPIRLSTRAQKLEIRFGPEISPAAVPTRLRYQLKGVDKEWQEADAGQMRLNVTFLDSANYRVDAHDFSAEGESIGWVGTVAGTRFVQRREDIPVPERASRVQLALFSGGPEGTMGVMAIDDLQVAAGPATDVEPLKLFSSQTAEGSDLPLPPAVPRGWMRDGSSPSMAQVLEVNGADPRHFLTVVDGDPMRWGAWHTLPELIIPVKPKETLTIQWREAYSIGWGGDATAAYGHLAPGNYLFELRAVNVAGEWTDQRITLPFIVVPPFWQQIWFRALAITLIVGLLLVAVRHATRQKIQLQLRTLERERAVEQERARIARDIHDDLGANLTQIALLSELAQADGHDRAQVTKHLGKIFSAARAMTRQLDEIVWAVDPANDSLEETAGYLCKFAQDYFANTGIRCRLDVPESTPSLHVSSAVRHDLFLVFKEAFNNIIKHGQATEVWVRIQREDQELMLQIEDNGKGFDELGQSEANPHGMGGRGIQNMKKRMTAIDARFQLRSRSGQGTTLSIFLSLRHR
jgi:signal transduction histidine kinase